MATTRVKICGITNLGDAQGAVAAGADALGFVFHPASPRYVAPERVADIVAALPPFITTVGLFVNTPAVKIHQIMVQTGLQMIQLHGDETAEQCRLSPPYPVIKALRVRDESSLDQLADYPVVALLLDAWSADHYGGTGRRFDWRLVSRATLNKPIILADGLDPANVASAIQLVNPYAVDVSSGVERQPGHKDLTRVARFIEQVRMA